MKKQLFGAALLGILLMTGCGKQQVDNQDSGKNSNQNNSSVYEHLMAANEKYGSDKDQVCKSNFKCDPSEISEDVIIAPTWEADIFAKHVDEIKHIAGPTGVSLKPGYESPY